jgi:hypothetical protein
MVFLDSIIKEALSYQNRVIDVARVNRGKKFSIEMCEPLVRFFKNISLKEKQEKSVFSLLKDSVEIHYEFLKDKRIELQDSVVLEHMQTPVVLELLYESDRHFKDAVVRFVEKIEEKKSFLRNELENIISGKYGLTNGADIRPTKGSTRYVLKRIADTTRLDPVYKDAILSSKSLGMNTSYFLGKEYKENLIYGKDLAFKKELKALKQIFEEPVASQIEFSKNVRSFSPKEYMKRFTDGIAEDVNACTESNVSYSNILSIPAFSVSDIGSHLNQETLDFFKDDNVFAILDSINKVVGLTVRDSFCKTPIDILKFASIASSASIVHLIKSGGLTVESVIKELRNRNLKEDMLHTHDLDFINMLKRESKRVDLTPMEGLNVQKPLIFSLIIGLVENLCLFQNEPLTTIVLANIAAKNKEKPLYLLFS